jgi:hypothetical protein
MQRPAREVATTSARKRVEMPPHTHRASACPSVCLCRAQAPLRSAVERMLHFEFEFELTPWLRRWCPRLCPRLAPPVRAGRFPDGSLQPAISLLLPPLATSMSEADHLEAQRQVGAPVYFTRRPMTVAEICIRLDQISKEYYHHRDKNRGGD